MGVRGELRMLETAVRRRYPIDAVKAAETVNNHLDDPDPRVALRAAGIAAVMEGQNQKDEHQEQDDFSQRLIELARQCGVDSDVIEALAITSRSATAGIGAAVGSQGKRTR